MKEGVLTHKDFVEFGINIIKNESFRPLKKREFKTELYLQNVEAPTHRTGREEGFIYDAFGLRVYVWTSFVVDLKGFRSLDSGWVLITENHKAVYFGPWLRRTKNFFKRLELWAHICREHIDARPVCPKCKKLMSIMTGDKGQHYWKCQNPIHWQNHEKAPNAKWDIGLSAGSILFLEKKRKAIQKYNKKRKLQGKPPHGSAIKNRKGWKKRSTPLAHAY